MSTISVSRTITPQVAEQIVFSTLNGKYKHFCPDLNGRAIDEFDECFDLCRCTQIETKNKGIIPIRR